MRLPAIRIWAVALCLLVATAAQADGKRYKKLYEEAYVIKNSDPEAAKAKLRKVLELAPADDVYHSKAEKLLRKIELESSAGGTAGDAPVTPLPNTRTGSEVKADAATLRKRGTEAYKKDDYAKAVQLYRLALKRNPRDVELHRLIGSVYAHMGRRKAAYEAYKAYLKRCPKCMYAPTVKRIVTDYEKIHSK